MVLSLASAPLSSPSPSPSPSPSSPPPTAIPNNNSHNTNDDDSNCNSRQIDSLDANINIVEPKVADSYTFKTASTSTSTHPRGGPISRTTSPPIPEIELYSQSQSQIPSQSHSQTPSQTLSKPADTLDKSDNPDKKHSSHNPYDTPYYSAPPDNHYYFYPFLQYPASPNATPASPNADHRSTKCLFPKPPLNYISPILAPHLVQVLSRDITLLSENLSPSSDAKQRRVKFILKIQAILDGEFPLRNIVAHLFGSSVNGLGSAQSDVDVCLVTPWDDKENGVANMHVLAAVLEKHGMTKISTITKAKVPICKFFDPQLKLKCDVNVNMSIALRNTDLITRYVELDPRVRPLLMVVKYWARRRQLNDAKGGTLSSYCWVMMVLNFLQLRDPPVLPSLQKIYYDLVDALPKGALPTGIPTQRIIDGVDCSFYDDTASVPFQSQNAETLGQLLYAFFRHYALDFDYDNDVASVRSACLLTKAGKAWDVDIERHVRFLCVEEPFTISRNLGNSADVINVLGLRDEFCRALVVLDDGGDLANVCLAYKFEPLGHQFPGMLPASSTGMSSGGYQTSPALAPAAGAMSSPMSTMATLSLSSAPTTNKTTPMMAGGGGAGVGGMAVNSASARSNEFNSYTPYRRYPWLYWYPPNYYYYPPVYNPNTTSPSQHNNNNNNGLKTSPPFFLNSMNGTESISGSSQNSSRGRRNNEHGNGHGQGQGHHGHGNGRSGGGDGRKRRYSADAALFSPGTQPSPWDSLSDYGENLAEGGDHSKGYSSRPPPHSVHAHGHGHSNSFSYSQQQQQLQLLQQHHQTGGFGHPYDFRNKKAYPNNNSNNNNLTSGGHKKDWKRHNFVENATQTHTYSHAGTQTGNWGMIGFLNPHHGYHIGFGGKGSSNNIINNLSTINNNIGYGHALAHGARGFQNYQHGPPQHYQGPECVNGAGGYVTGPIGCHHPQGKPRKPAAETSTSDVAALGRRSLEDVQRGKSLPVRNKKLVDAVAAESAVHEFGTEGVGRDSARANHLNPSSGSSQVKKSKRRRSQSLIAPSSAAAITVTQGQPERRTHGRRGSSGGPDVRPGSQEDDSAQVWDGVELKGVNKANAVIWGRFRTRDKELVFDELDSRENPKAEALTVAEALITNDHTNGKLVDESLDYGSPCGTPLLVGGASVPDTEPKLESCKLGKERSLSAAKSLSKSRSNGPSSWADVTKKRIPRRRVSVPVVETQGLSTKSGALGVAIDPDLKTRSLELTAEPFSASEN